MCEGSYRLRCALTNVRLLVSFLAFTLYKFMKAFRWKGTYDGKNPSPNESGGTKKTGGNEQNHRDFYIMYLIWIKKKKEKTKADSFDWNRLKKTHTHIVALSLSIKFTSAFLMSFWLFFSSYFSFSFLPFCYESSLTTNLFSTLEFINLKVWMSKVYVEKKTEKRKRNRIENRTNWVINK